MPDDVREKLEERLNGGWEFNPQLWADSKQRHKRWDMAKVFAKFDMSKVRASTCRKVGR